MNTWEIRKTAIVEADDFQDRYDRNGLNFLFYWKAKYPKFRITLFTIPEKTTFFSLLPDWIEIAVHGWNHESNFECYGWDYDTTITYLNRLPLAYKKIFKAPGWSITPGQNGYPSAPEDPITKDPQAVYKALNNMGFIVADRHYNALQRPPNTKVVCIDDNPDIVHMHTWNMMTADPNGRNGFEQVEVRGVPWDQNTEFFTVSEAWDMQLYKECHD